VTYQAGDKIALKDIVPGDKVRFQTKYTRDQTDTVELIVPLPDDNLRARAFCDINRKVINSFPDSVTDAYLLERSPDRERLDAEEVLARQEAEYRARVEDAKEAYAMNAMYSLELGSTFFKDYESGWLVWTKIGKDTWKQVETFNYGGHEPTIDTLDTAEVFEEVYDEDSGNCQGLVTDDN
jgi:hypothetical protein